LLNGILDMPAAIATFRAIPPSLGFRIAKSLGHDPEHVAAHPELIDIAVTRQATWAQAELRRDSSVDVLVMAHTHRPALLDVAPGRSYVHPGAWLDGQRYAVVDDSRVELASFT